MKKIWHKNKKCKVCKTDFIDKTRSSNRLYCSKKCRMVVYNSSYAKSPKGRYAIARKESTRSRNKNKSFKNWELTVDQYSNLIKDNKCHYCEGPLPNFGSSLDRLDPCKSYNIKNVVPCCKICNYIKGDILTEEETLKVVKLIKKLRGDKKPWSW